MTSPPPSPPNAKKPKVSSPPSPEEESRQEEETSPKPLRPPLPLPPDASKPRYKRKKLAIFFGYCGYGYQGMQKNPGAKTIESDLEEALYLSFAVNESDRGLSRRYDWARSARTDKGVSAAGQVVSGLFYFDPPGLVDRLNSHLPTQIRIFGYKRVTASFSAKKFCDRRRYVYLLPVFALDPEAHRDRESVMASVGSGCELSKCLECSERGRKVPGLMGRGTRDGSHGVPLDAGNSEEKNDSDGNGASAGLDVSSRSTGPNACAVMSLENCVMDAVDSTNGSHNEDDCSAIQEAMVDTSELTLQSQLVASGQSPVENGRTSDGFGRVEEDLKTSEKTVGRKKFEYGEKEKDRFNAILKRYVGTHNFHNFTTRTKAEDPSARRYILSFDASTLVEIDGIGFVRCEVVGQSFMLHQIRKMIGLAVAIMRNCTRESIMDSALTRDVRINVPTAPEVGLYLEECLFTSYNQKWKDTHEELSMSCYAKEAEEFKMKYIYSHIASMERQEGSVALWLHSLNHRNYPDLLLQGEGSHGNGTASVVEVAPQLDMLDEGSHGNGTASVVEVAPQLDMLDE